jgi:hypothetical protein
MPQWKHSAKILHPRTLCQTLHSWVATISITVVTQCAIHFNLKMYFFIKIMFYFNLRTMLITPWNADPSGQPRDIRHEMSSLTRTLGSWVRIPLKAWTFVCVYSLFELSCVGSGLMTGYHPAPTSGTMESGRQILTASHNQTTEQNQNSVPLGGHRIYFLKIKIKFEYHLLVRNNSSFREKYKTRYSKVCQVLGKYFDFTEVNWLASKNIMSL